MQTRTNLGLSLGKMLAGAFDGNAYQKGQLDGTEIQYKKAGIDKYNSEAEKNRAEVANSSDDALIKSLTAGLQNGVNGDNALNDFKAFTSGSYKPRQQQGPMMSPDAHMPAPEYVNKFPALVQQLSKLQQMRALGDKNLPNLSKSIQGDQRNAITENLGTATPQQAAEIGMRTSAIEGNVNPLEMQKAAILYGLTNGQNSLDNQNALLLSQGKTRFDDMSGKGSIDALTGNNVLNDLGYSDVTKNKANAAQSYSAVGVNNAKVGQIRSAEDLNRANIILSGAKVGQTNSAAALNNANAENVRNKAKGAVNGNLGALDSIDTATESLDKIINHPGREESTGTSAILNNISMPGTDRANFLADLDAFKSQMFIPMVQQMKGMGQLSDAEGKKLMAAIGALDPSMSESEFKNSANNILMELKVKRARATGDKTPRVDLVNKIKNEGTKQNKPKSNGLPSVSNW